MMQPAPAYSEEALALELADLHADHLRYVAHWKRWMLFDGARWVHEPTLWVQDQARDLCREHAVLLLSMKREGEAKKLASDKTVNAVVSLLRADRRIAATVDQWDRDPRALNTPAGIVDLRTGGVRKARPEDYCTKITAVAPSVGLEGECPLWDDFLTTVTAGNQDLIGFLRRICGYALTGLTSEHALFFLYGTGGNGKSVFIDTISAILGGYHTTAAMTTFTATRNEQHPTDIAKLMGARLVTAVESEEGSRWAEAKIKQLTGGDTVTGRFMRQDFFDFHPQFKLLIAGNHKPGLRSVDVAMRRRFNLIPFEVKIPKEDQDKDLAENLRGEWPSILSWMKGGCVEWLKDGLAPPECVLKATDEYMTQEDAVGAWLTQCCILNAQAKTSSSRLFESWSRWARAANEYVGSQKSFCQKLRDRGFLSLHTMTGTEFIGLECPLSQDEQDDQERRNAYQRARYPD
jgi:putative DNA primase/helicase